MTTPTSRGLYSEQELERIYRAALRVLGEMGMRVENRPCLEAMERFGARVDYPRERAIFPREVIERALDMARTHDPTWRRGFRLLDPGYECGGDGACPFYYSERNGDRRRATEADCIEALKIVEASGVTHSGLPTLNGDVGHKYEAIRCLELAIETLDHTVIGGTDLFFPEQVPFVVEMGRLYRNDPGWFLPGANCITSPLTIGKTIADLAVAKAPYSTRSYIAPPMPVMGANSPMTPAGTAVVGVAEILGSYVLAKSLNPETRVGALALCALMDMQQGHMVFCAPEVLDADIAICETMERMLGLPCQAYGGYVDAKLPGMRAVREKLFRSLGPALYSGMTGFSGALDQGKVFSPTQMMLDQDLHDFLARYLARPAVNDETLAVDAIVEIGWDRTGYLTHEHTRKHMRETWRSRIYERTPWLSMADERGKEASYLERARQQWQDRLASYRPPSHPEGFLRELRKISASARQALTGIRT
jgi:trimethylamine--corrinoid protein Co-methyltransferase